MSISQAHPTDGARGSRSERNKRLAAIALAGVFGIVVWRQVPGTAGEDSPPLSPGLVSTPTTPAAANPPQAPPRRAAAPVAMDIDVERLCSSNPFLGAGNALPAEAASTSAPGGGRTATLQTRATHQPGVAPSRSAPATDAESIDVQAIVVGAHGPAALIDGEPVVINDAIDDSRRVIAISVAGLYLLDQEPPAAQADSSP